MSVGYIACDFVPSRQAPPVLGPSCTTLSNPVFLTLQYAYKNNYGFHKEKESCDYLCVCTCMYMNVSACLCKCLCICMCIYVYVCLCMFLCVLCVCKYVHGCTRVCVCRFLKQWHGEHFRAKARRQLCLGPRSTELSFHSSPGSSQHCF